MQGRRLIVVLVQIILAITLATATALTVKLVHPLMLLSDPVWIFGLGILAAAFFGIWLGKRIMEKAWPATANETITKPSL